MAGNTHENGCYTEYGVSGYGVAARLSRDEPMAESFVKHLAETLMLDIARRCLDKGAKCIGHIKSHLRTAAGTIKADTIGTGHGSYSSGKLSQPVCDLYMAINSIVQGIPENLVRTATLDGISAIAEQYGIEVVKEKEHTYFDEFDFTASKQEFIQKLAEQIDGPPSEKDSDG